MATGDAVLTRRLLLGLLLSGVAAAGAADAPVGFVAHRLGRFRSEALGVADFNRDGRLDIVAGAYLYLAPEWTALKIRTLAGEVDGEGKGYHDDFMNVPLDVDGDGAVDVVSCGWFCKCIRWHRNSLGEAGDWPEHVALEDGNFESGDLADIDGDGREGEVLANTAMTMWVEPGEVEPGRRGLVKRVISDRPMSYGGGVGDINGDGRPDVLRPDAWFEAPADPRAGAWVEHAWAMGGKNGTIEHTPQMLVLDVNADGLADVVTSSAHQSGIFWYEQVRRDGEASWTQHVIDESWTQAHSLALADIDGDGTVDLITGKRFMAHNGSDPDEYGKLGVYWYRLERGREPKWTKHAISYDEGIGSGVNLCAVDLDADGDVDVVVTGKWGGPVWFENTRLR